MRKSISKFTIGNALEDVIDGSELGDDRIVRIVVVGGYEKL